MNIDTYQQAITYLYSLQGRGMKFGLRGIKRLLTVLNNPHSDLRAIHIAGTNGKGSTAAMIASTLQEGGYKTGLYTSPHLVRFNERIRVNGVEISNRDIINAVRKLKPYCEKFQSTFFEATTTIAFQYFKEKNVDYVVLETGLGGRLDSTNVCKPLVTVITSIDYDHKDILGETIEEIAFEKAGIIKGGIPCICGVTNNKARAVIRRVCREKNAEFIRPARLQTNRKSESLTSQRLYIVTKNRKREGLDIGLSGEYQAHNCAVAWSAIAVLRDRGRVQLTDEAIKNGFRNVRMNTGIQGRFDLILSRPNVIVDVAHNPHAMAHLVKSLQRLRKTPVILVMGVMRDKEYQKMVKTVAPIVQYAITVQARTSRSLAAMELFQCFKRHNVQTTNGGTVQAGVALALKMAGKCPVVITGSHFVAGEALAKIFHKKYLTINQ
jgi:dihydrofolate synthase/folylpolyglutamate synthase